MPTSGTYELLSFLVGPNLEMQQAFGFYFTLMIIGSLCVWIFFLCLRILSID